MTKLFSIIAVAIIATSVVSCGPSAEDKAKMEQLAIDSVETARLAAEAASTEVAPDSTTAPVAAETATPAAEAHTH